ncbi:MAG: hypothetical protein ACK5HO_05920 [Pseudomonadota bacterium]
MQGQKGASAAVRLYLLEGRVVFGSGRGCSLGSSKPSTPANLFAPHETTARIQDTIRNDVPRIPRKMGARLFTDDNKKCVSPLCLAVAKLPQSASIGPERTTLEIVFDQNPNWPWPLKSNPKLQFAIINPPPAMIYPSLATIAAGKSSTTHTTHSHVHSSFRQHRDAMHCYETDIDKIFSVSAWLDGNNYLLRIEPPGADLSREEFLKLASQYEQAIDIAETRARQKGGRVILLADDNSKRFTVKLINRLHLVDEPNQSISEVVRQSIFNTSTGAQCIYNLYTGIRYFLLNDIEKLPINTLEVLCSLFENRNKMGSREVQVLLVEPGSDHIVNKEEVLTAFANDLRQLYTSFKDYSDDSLFRKSLSEVVNKYRRNCHPDFHGINLDSRRFVEVTSKLLAGISDGLNLGQDFSTPLRAEEFGYFRVNAEGAREFVLTTKDSKLHDIGHWLLSNDGQQQIAKVSDSSEIAQADFICVYRPQRPLTFEKHPAKFVRRFGDLSAESFIVEFGKVGEAPTRIVIEDNVFAPSRWQERDTIAVRYALGAITGSEIFEWAAKFKDSQHRLFDSLLALLNETQVKLAPPYEYVSIPEVGSSDAGRHLYHGNYRIRRFVNGQRSDLAHFDQRRVGLLDTIMPMLGDLMAVGLVAQVSQLPLRDIIIRGNDAQSIAGITYLSAGESFCNSGDAKDADDYLNGIAPRLLGNFLARWIAALGYSSSGGPNKDGFQQQQILLEHCVSVLGRRLSELCEDSPTNLAKNLLDLEIGKYGGQSPDKRTFLGKERNISHFLPLSSRILDRLAQVERLHELCEQIKTVAKAELDLINQLAKPGQTSSQPTSWETTEALAIAVSQLIENHLPDAESLLKAREHLSTLANLELLSANEKNWAITLFDIALRISELRMVKRHAPLIATAFNEANAEDDFVASFPSVNLSDETKRACYAAIQGLKDSFIGARGNKEKKTQLKLALGHLKTFRMLFAGN